MQITRDELTQRARRRDFVKRNHYDDDDGDDNDDNDDELRKFWKIARAKKGESALALPGYKGRFHIDQPNILSY